MRRCGPVDKDLDFFFLGGKDAAIEKMLSLATSTSIDYFDFEVRVKTRVTGAQPDNATSFHISARLDGRRFEDINVDMEIGEVITFQTERLKSQEFSSLLASSRAIYRSSRWNSISPRKFTRIHDALAMTAKTHASKISLTWC